VKGVGDDVRLFTSRYSNPGIVELEGLATPVGFTNGHPRFPLKFKLAANLRDIAPDRSTIQMEDQVAFSRVYRERLNTMGLSKIITLLESVDRGERPGLILLCFEDIRLPGVWCHRTIFGAWWQEQTGEKVEELPDPSTPKGQKRSAVVTPLPPQGFVGLA
jgi:hypothetical protein